MARRKSPPSKSAGLGMGLDALIKAKTRDENNEIEENQLKNGSDENEITEDSDDIKVFKSQESKKSVSKPSDSAASKAEKSNKSLISKSTTTNDVNESASAETQRINIVISDVKKNPRITLWSSRSAAVLRYLKKTQPEFSISKEASKLIEESVKEKYPEIWDLFDDL
ncbi:MAG: AAA family ATPase [Methanobacteriales archaeon HGW-Methanobacteriales-1]|nr:MAG: AAA family ATPase [Methanobacteriales archaeon HGW-Methanobacteriales-1]